jgi:hypothetical protein
VTRTPGGESGGTDPASTAAVPDPPWTFSVEELLAAGFDDIGVFQPVLRSREHDQGWPQRRTVLLRRMAEAGLLEREADGWQPSGALRTVMAIRATATSISVIASPPSEPAARVVLGRFAGPDGLLVLELASDDVKIWLTDRAALAWDVLATVPALPDLLKIDTQAIDAPDVPVRRVRLQVARTAGDRFVAVLGERRGEDTAERRAELTPEQAVAAIAEALVDLSSRD